MPPTKYLVLLLLEFQTSKVLSFLRHPWSRPTLPSPNHRVGCKHLPTSATSMSSTPPPSPLATALTDLIGDHGLQEFDDLEGRITEALLQSMTFTVDGKSVGAELVSPASIRGLLCPLCYWLRYLVTSKPPGSGRVVVGVIGPAGAGKSVLTSVICGLLNLLFPEGQEWAITLSMDGYHYPNSYLESHGLDGNPLSPKDPSPALKTIKGMLETIDVGGLVRDLEHLHEQPPPPEVGLPIYDRQLHDPVPGALQVKPSHRLILVEGLHLLHRGDSRWDRVGSLLHYTIFLDVPKHICRPRVVERKVSRGRARDCSEAHFDRVDSPIFDRLQQEKVNADMVVGLAADSEPTSIRLGGKFMSWLVKATTSSQARGDVQGGKSRVLILGLNPAVQKVLGLSHLRVGEVNRVSEVTVGIGGKGQNCAKAMLSVPRLRSREREVTLAQLSGGRNGDDLVAMLEAKGVKLLNQVVAAPTRTCYTLSDGARDPATVTEIVEPGSQVSQEDQDGLLDKMRVYLRQEDMGDTHDRVGLVFMGSTPPGTARDFYAQVLSIPTRVQRTVLIDTVVGLSELLSTGIKIHALKINQQELRQLSKASLGSQADDGIEKLGASFLHSHPNLEALAVTAGPGEALLLLPGPPQRPVVVYRYRLPACTVVNPIGAGDTCAGVTMAFLLARYPLLTAFWWGLAAATASCFSSENALFDFTKAASIAEQITMEISTHHDG